MKSLIVVLMLNSLIGMSKAGPPDWFINGEHRQYPGDMYFFGVGSGESYDAAIESASTQIMRQIEVAIDSEVSKVTSSVARGMEEAISEEFKVVSNSVAKGSLTGAEIAEKEKVGDTFYALVVVDKDSYLMSMEEELGQIRSSILAQYTDSDNLINSGDIITGIGVLIDTKPQAEEYYAKSMLLTSLSGKPQIYNDVISPEAINSKFKTIIKNVNLEIVSGNGQSALNGSLFAVPFVVKATYKNKPLKQFNVELFNVVSKETEQMKTDENGEATFWMYAVGDYKTSLNAVIDIKNAPSSVKTMLNEIGCRFDCTILEVPPLDLVIEVYNADGKVRNKEVEKSVEKAVVKAGHHLVEQGDYKIRGVINIVDQHEIDGIDGTQYLAKTEMDIRLIHLATGNQIASITVAGKGLDKRSAGKAAEKALSKQKISQSELSKMFAKARDSILSLNIVSSRTALEKGKKHFENGDYNEALLSLSKVVADEELILQSRELVQKIKELQSVE